MAALGLLYRVAWNSTWRWNTTGIPLEVAQMVKNLPANAGDAGDAGSIPRSGRSPGEGNDNPFKYSCLENPVNRGAW